MPRLKIRSRAAQEEAGLWLKRIEAFKDAWKRGETKRDKYRRAIQLNLEGLAGKNKTGESSEELVAIHLPHRIHAWFQSAAYDEFPEIRYPRDAGEDATYGPMVERVITRILDDADAVRAFRRGLTRIMSDGVMAVGFGLPSEPMLKDVEAANLGAGEVTEAVLQGAHQPHPMQDHLTIVKALLGLAMGNPERMRAFPPEVQARVWSAAADHMELAESEKREPKRWTTTKGQIWVNHYEVGRTVVWDPSVTDVKDARWMARLLPFYVDQAQSNPAFDPRARKFLTGDPLSGRDPTREGEAEVALDGMDQSERDQENTRVNVWEIWDRKHHTRHYVPERMRDMEVCYLEVDEANPYVDPSTGDSILPGYFPFVVCAPITTEKPSVENTFGVPGLEPGWDIIKAILRYETHTDAAIKRFPRKAVFHPLWKDDDIAALMDPDDGVGVKAPEGIDAVQNGGVWPIEWKPVSEQLLQERDRKISLLSMLMGIPRSALVGEPVAETLGQEEIAEAAQHSQTVDIVGQVEAAFAELAEGIRALAKKYPDEQIAALIGQKYVEQWDGWRGTSTAGDKLRVTLAPKDKNLRRIHQIMQALQAGQQALDPMTGLPYKDMKPVVEELFFALGIGDIPDFQSDPVAIVQGLVEQHRDNPDVIRQILQVLLGYVGETMTTGPDVTSRTAPGGAAPNQARTPPAPRQPSPSERGLPPRTGSAPNHPQDVGGG